jgi:hypothetical protein
MIRFAAVPIANRANEEAAMSKPDSCATNAQHRRSIAGVAKKRPPRHETGSIILSARFTV